MRQVTDRRRTIDTEEWTSAQPATKASINLRQKDCRFRIAL